MEFVELGLFIQIPKNVIFFLSNHAAIKITMQNMRMGGYLDTSALIVGQPKVNAPAVMNSCN